MGQNKVLYINKADVIAEIRRRLDVKMDDVTWWEDKGASDAYKSILSFIDTLEVKEVDLENK